MDLRVPHSEKLVLQCFGKHSYDSAAPTTWAARPHCWAARHPEKATLSNYYKFPKKQPQLMTLGGTKGALGGTATLRPAPTSQEIS